MSQPITPRMAIEEVELELMSVQFNPEFTAGVWVQNTGNVKIFSRGFLSGTSGSVANADIELSYIDLPPAAQTALITVRDAVEVLLAAKYDP